MGESENRMKFENEQPKVFTRRSFILGGIQSALTLGLIGRLYVLQVVHSKHYQLLSDKNRIQSVILPPARGKIYDRSGIALAENQTSYRSVFSFEKIEEIDQVIDKLKHILSLSEQTITSVKSQVRKRKRNLPIVLKEGLTWDELAKIELHCIDLPGVMIEKGQSRLYPHSFETCHAIGYVAAVSEKDLDGTPLLETPGF